MRVLAAAAGLVVAKPEPDITGEDFTFTYKGKLGARRHPKIDAQVKSWRESSAVYRDDSWRYSMLPKHFNELAGPGFSLPRFLFLVIVPDEWQDYSASKADALTLKYCAYWVSLAQRTPVPRDQRGKVPVTVPAANILTAEKLLELMSYRVDGERSS